MRHRSPGWIAEVFHTGSAPQHAGQLPNAGLPPVIPAWSWKKAGKQRRDLLNALKRHALDRQQNPSNFTDLSDGPFKDSQ
jgi:hypothetical protein